MENAECSPRPTERRILNYLSQPRTTGQIVDHLREGSPSVFPCAQLDWANKPNNIPVA
jgi:hypothetical protein